MVSEKESKQQSTDANQTKTNQEPFEDDEVTEQINPTSVGIGSVASLQQISSATSNLDVVQPEEKEHESPLCTIEVREHPTVENETTEKILPVQRDEYSNDFVENLTGASQIKGNSENQKTESNDEEHKKEEKY